uniref:ubiquinol-cytochrome-c reductase complex assembly factor 3-like isoform X2 n=1 Tax=Myxine glutinosa TaxID=7769 RepID=UPI00358E7C38
MTLRVVVRGVIGFLGVGAVAAVSWFMVAPTEEREERTRREIPLKKQEMLKSTNKQLMDILKEAAETNENVVANPNWQRK